jgi:hypothetical protein
VNNDVVCHEVVHSANPLDRDGGPGNVESLTP